MSLRPTTDIRLCWNRDALPHNSLNTKSLISASIAIDHSRWTPIDAVRSTIGVAIPTAIAVMMGHPGVGALSSIGALYTGFAASSGVHKGRVRAMIVSGALIGFGTTVGVAVGNSLIASIIAVFAIAFATALYSCSGRAASTTGAQTTAIVCIAIGLELPANEAFLFGGLVIAGSAIQLFLLTVVWPTKAGLHERMAIADVYDSLARFVIELETHALTDLPLIPPAQPFVEARTILSEADRFDWRNDHDVLLDELRRAEALRAALVGFARSHAAYSAQSNQTSLRSRRMLHLLHRGLISHSNRLRRGDLEPYATRIRIPELANDSVEAVDYANWLKLMRDLIQRKSFDSGNELRASVASVTSVDSRSLFSILTRLPDVDSVRSVAFQHAIRYAVTVLFAFVVSRFWNEAHSFWLPITVALVLRQDYGTTFQRGMSRIIGSVAGLAIADIVLNVLHPGPIAVQLLIVAVTWIAFAGAGASYAIATFAITGFVVFTISLSGVAVQEIAAIRLIASLIGVILAIATYMLWPAWHWPQIWETLRLAVRSQIDYGEAVLAEHRDSSPANIAAIHLTRANARALRIQSENLIASAQVHPKGRDAKSLKEAMAISQTLEENAAVLLAAEAEWNMGHPETDSRIRASLSVSRSLLAVAPLTSSTS